jgi:hypothetical protein
MIGDANTAAGQLGVIAFNTLNEAAKTSSIIVQGIVGIELTYVLNVKNQATELWDGLKTTATTMWTDMTKISDDNSKTVNDIITGNWAAVPGDLAVTWTDIKTLFSNSWNNIKTNASDTYELIKAIWFPLAGWFKNIVITPVKNFFASGLATIRDTWENIWIAIAHLVDVRVATICGFIQKIIDMINAAILKINALTGLKIPTINIPIHYVITTTEFTVKTTGFSTDLYAPPLTPLRGKAKGGVFPPNAPFAAMLGDQTSGKNIETPESLMRQIVREEMGNTGNGGNITIKFDGTMGALVRVLRPYIVKEESRIGTSLIVGGTV